MEQFWHFSNSSSMPSKVTKSKSRAWIFTWNNPPDDAVEQLLEKFGEFEYVFQFEKVNTLHIQGVMRFPNPRSNWPVISEKIHWQRCRSWRAQIKYCCKLESRVRGPWTNVEGLKYRKSLRDPLAKLELYAWQKEILDIIRREPEFRKIYWYWDSVGCAGKTSLARHVKIKYGDGIMYVNGCSRDILCTFAKRLDEGTDCTVIFFGLTRQDANKMSYKSLEIFSDGIGYSGKYESTDLIFNPPHVIVFANFPPELSNVSSDRWIVREI